MFLMRFLFEFRRFLFLLLFSWSKQKSVCVCVSLFVCAVRGDLLCKNIRIHRYSIDLLFFLSRAFSRISWIIYSANFNYFLSNFMKKLLIFECWTIYSAKTFEKCAEKNLSFVSFTSTVNLRAELRQFISAPIKLAP